MAVEDASFSTVMSSMSDAGISEMDSTGKPSTINSGVLSPVIEPPPRTRIFISASGDPSVVVICTPAILPVNASVADATGTTVNASEFTVATEPVKSFFLAVPYPITTTSSSACASSAKITSIVFCPLTAISCVVIPT